MLVRVSLITLCVLLLMFAFTFKIKFYCLQGRLHVNSGPSITRPLRMNDILRLEAIKTVTATVSLSLIMMSKMMSMDGKAFSCSSLVPEPV